MTHVTDKGHPPSRAPMSPVPTKVASTASAQDDPRKPVPNYLSPQQLSERSGLSIATVRRYVRDGKLPFAQPGGPRGRILIPAHALDQIEVTPSREGFLFGSQACPTGHGLDGQTPRRRGPLPAWRRTQAD